MVYPQTAGWLIAHLRCWVMSDEEMTLLVAMAAWADSDGREIMATPAQMRMTSGLRAADVKRLLPQLIKKEFIEHYRTEPGTPKLKVYQIARRMMPQHPFTYTRKPIARWHRQTPQKPGFYWVRMDGCGHCFVVWLDEDGQMTSGTRRLDPSMIGLWWCGPIKSPESEDFGVVGRAYSRDDYGELKFEILMGAE